LPIGITEYSFWPIALMSAMYRLSKRREPKHAILMLSPMRRALSSVLADPLLVIDAMAGSVVLEVSFKSTRGPR